MSTPGTDTDRKTFKLGGLRGFFKNPGLFLTTWRAGGFIGRDALGNQYFERPGRKGWNFSRRWVVYAGEAEATTVPPEWHAWLHHLTEQPLPAAEPKFWQKPHLPNRTGTPESYRPAGHDYMGGKRARNTSDYEAWTPGQE